MREAAGTGELAVRLTHGGSNTCLVLTKKVITYTYIFLILKIHSVLISSRECCKNEESVLKSLGISGQQISLPLFYMIINMVFWFDNGMSGTFLLYPLILGNVGLKKKDSPEAADREKSTEKHSWYSKTILLGVPFRYTGERRAVACVITWR